MFNWLTYFKLKPTIAIVSSGRTGTNFFESFFKIAAPDAFVAHEPQPDLFELGMGKIRGELQQEQVIKQFRIARDTLFFDAYFNGKTRYIESNPNLFCLLPEFKRYFKRIKVIYVVRDPRTYVQSALNKSPLNDGVYFYEDSDGRKRLSALDFDGDPYFDKWTNFSRLQKISWAWNKYNEIIYSYYEKHQDRVILLKFEDVFSDQEEIRRISYDRLLNLLSIENSPEKVDELLSISLDRKNATRSDSYGSFNEWDESDKKSVLEITEQMRAKLGY